MECANVNTAMDYTLKMIRAVSGRVAGGMPMKYGAKIAPIVMLSPAMDARNNARPIVYIRTIIKQAYVIGVLKMAIPCAETVTHG